MKIKISTGIWEDSPTLALSVAAVGGRNTTQSYDEASGEYVPDRTLTPTILEATVMSGSDDIGSEVSAKGWYLVDESGTSPKQIQITTGNQGTLGFELYPTGYPLGIKVKRNVDPEKPLKLLFKVTARGVTAMEQVTFRTAVIPAQTPDLELDFPTASAWNPFRTDMDKVSITPKVRDYGHTDLSLHWMKAAGTGWREIAPSSPEDCELSLDSATKALTVDRRWMGEAVYLACELRKSGTTVRRVTVAMRRRIPGFRRLDALYSREISDSDTSVYCEADIELESMGRLKNPEQEFAIRWLDGAKVFGTGKNATYIRKKGDPLPELAMDVEDRGPLKLFTVGGQYLTIGGVLVGGR